MSEFCSTPLGRSHDIQTCSDADMRLSLHVLNHGYLKTSRKSREIHKR